MNPDTDPLQVDTEPLDILLDGAAPPRPALGHEFALMALDARRATRRNTSRAARVGLGVGLVALLAGGAGTAFAAGVFSWQGWAADPDIAYSYALPGGRQCEVRIHINDAPSAGDGIPTPSANGAVLRDWARAADFTRLVDVDAEIAALDPADGIPIAWKTNGRRVEPDPAGPDAIMIVLGDDGHLDVVPKAGAGPDADDLYAHAVMNGIDDAIRAEAVRIGGPDGVDGWATDLAAACEPRP